MGSADEGRVRLERRIAMLERREALVRRTDELIERSLGSSVELERLLTETLRALVDATGAEGARFSALGGAVELGSAGMSTALSSALVVDRTPLGEVSLHGSLTAPREEASALLDAWVEVLDDYLAMRHGAARRHRVGRSLSEALLEPSLDLGVEQAVGLLAAEVPLDSVWLVFRPAHGAGPLHRRWYHRTRAGRIEPRHADPEFEAAAPEFLEDGGPDRFLDRVGVPEGRAVEELLVGIRDRRPLGRLVAARAAPPLTEDERALVQVLADALRHRLVDYSREHAQLSTCFPPRAVARLLSEPSYHERFLEPREAEVAILYADIAGFTRVSEQRLKAPSAIGRLVDAWGNTVVRTIWATGGVFDKMVGDCVIGLWGPPFFEGSPEDWCRSALEAAERIRVVTAELPLDPGLPELAHLDGELGVATGLHFAPLYVGTFGPNADFTGFSSGMNDAARLQGLAERDQILAMERFVDQVGAERFGPLEQAAVKNVAQPLRFRRLR